MRIAPRAPKAPPTFVSSWMGAGVGVADAEVVFALALEEEVGVAVTREVTLKVVGTTATVGTFSFPFRIVVLTVTLLVVRERMVLTEGDGVIELEALPAADDWA